MYFAVNNYHINGLVACFRNAVKKETDIGGNEAGVCGLN